MDAAVELTRTYLQRVLKKTSHIRLSRYAMRIMLKTSLFLPCILYVQEGGRLNARRDGSLWRHARGSLTLQESRIACSGLRVMRLPSKTALFERNHSLRIII